MNEIKAMAASSMSSKHERKLSQLIAGGPNDIDN